MQENEKHSGQTSQETRSSEMSQLQALVEKHEVELALLRGRLNTIHLAGTFGPTNQIVVERIQELEWRDDQARQYIQHAQEREHRIAELEALLAAQGGQGMVGRTDTGHVTRISDSSLYDEVCVNCGATDGLDDSLARPCPKAASPVQGAQEDELPSGEPSQEELDKWADPAFMGWYRKFAHWDSKEEAFKAWEQAHLAAPPVQAAQDPPGTLRLTCGCVSHLCEQHQKEIAAPPVQTSGMTELVHAVTQYAIKKGEAWRVGEGTEIMDALCHQGGVTTAAIPPNTYRGFNGETCELKTSTGQPPVQGAGMPRFDEWFKTYLPGVNIPLRCDEHMKAAWDAALAAHQSPVTASARYLELAKDLASLFFCPDCTREQHEKEAAELIAEEFPSHQSPVEALRERIEAIRDEIEREQMTANPIMVADTLRKIATKLTRALAAQKKPPQMSVRYCGHEAPVGKACPVCFPAQEKPPADSANGSPDAR